MGRFRVKLYKSGTYQSEIGGEICPKTEFNLPLQLGMRENIKTVEKIRDVSP